MTLYDLLKGSMNSQDGSMMGSSVLSCELVTSDGKRITDAVIKEDPNSEGDYAIFLTDVDN